MFKLIKENKKEIILISANITKQDKNFLIKIGEGNMNKGLRLIIASVRKELEKVMKKSTDR